MIESSIVLKVLFKEIIDYSIGTSVSVEFNFERIWDFFKKDGDIYNCNFIHVHPRGFLELSETDKNCMKGFYQAFNEEIHFIIITFDNDDLFDTNHKIKKFTKTNYADKSIIEDEVDELDLIPDSILLFLKYLSYGEIK